MPDPAPALELLDVSKRYGPVIAVDGVTLRVPPGSCLALVGESGSGKTTLLRMFNRTIDPDTGTVRVAGREIGGEDPVALRRRTGYVPQEGGLLPHWRVTRNVGLVPWLEGTDPVPPAREALRLVGLDPDRFGDRWPAELSGGQRQRVAIARALAARPPVLLLDEAFGALDAISRAELHEVFLDLRRELALTTVLVTHDLGEAARLATDLAVMRGGRLEQAGPVAEVLATPATAYVARLVRHAREAVP